MLLALIAALKGDAANERTPLANSNESGSGEEVHELHRLGARYIGVLDTQITEVSP